jgi:DNA-3-methyladenine glycosylase II
MLLIFFTLEKYFTPAPYLAEAMTAGNFQESRFSEAEAHLSSSDRVLAGLIGKIGACRLGRRDDFFISLLVSIINQQLSGSAADSIFRKFLIETGDRITPDRVMGLSSESFRRSGISRSKERFIRELAQKFSHDESFLSGILDKPDPEVLSSLTALNGVGRWTAEMFMIFSLNRPDVLPLGDAGFRKSVSRFYLEGRKATDEEILEISEKWRPYRSIAVWHLWRSLDGLPRGPIQA